MAPGSISISVIELFPVDNMGYLSSTTRALEAHRCGRFLRREAGNHNSMDN